MRDNVRDKRLAQLKLAAVAERRSYFERKVGEIESKLAGVRDESTPHIADAMLRGLLPADGGKLSKEQFLTAIQNYLLDPSGIFAGILDASRAELGQQAARYRESMALLPAPLGPTPSAWQRSHMRWHAQRCEMALMGAEVPEMTALRRDCLRDQLANHLAVHAARLKHTPPTPREPEPVAEAASEAAVEAAVEAGVEAGAGVDDELRSSPSTAVDPLRQAALNGECGEVARLLDSGADLDASHEATGETALFIAANNGNCGVMRALLAKNADVNKPNSRVSSCAPRLPAFALRPREAVPPATRDRWR